MIETIRTFRGYYPLDSGIELQINSLDELNDCLIKYGSKDSKDNQVINKLYEGPLDSSIIYYLQQGNIIRAIQIVEILDTFNPEPFLLLYSKLTCFDFLFEELINIDTYSNYLMNGKFRNLLPSSVSKECATNLEDYLFNGGTLAQGEYQPNQDIFLLIGKTKRLVDIKLTILVTEFILEIKKEDKAFLSNRYPEILEAYDKYKGRIKLNISTRMKPIEDYVFFCRNFITFKGDEEVPPHEPTVLDERLDFFPEGPYYCVQDGVKEVSINNIYSSFSIEDKDIKIKTCIEYEYKTDIETNIESNTGTQSITWEGEYGYLPPVPIPQCHLYLLFYPYLERKDFFHPFRYPYTDGIGTPYSYPFKYLYPDGANDSLNPGLAE